MLCKVPFEFFYCRPYVAEALQLCRIMLRCREETKANIARPFCWAACDQKVAILCSALCVSEHENSAEGANADQPVRIWLGLHTTGKVAKLSPITQT